MDDLDRERLALLARRRIIADTLVSRSLVECQACGAERVRQHPTALDHLRCSACGSYDTLRLPIPGEDD